MKPIYEPRGAAKEYGDFAINIYTGCPHRCYYCFAPMVLHRDRETFHSCVEPRPGIIEATRKQLEKERITDKLIHLCFTCDPYPIGYDTSATREIVKLLKAHGNHVQILTKSNGERDIDLLDENDCYGITLDGSEHGEYVTRMSGLWAARDAGVKTWISFEPVIRAEAVLHYIEVASEIGVDKVKIGKLNYYPSDIDWAEFGRKAEHLCQSLGLDYYIKDGLRQKMEEQDE